MPDSADATSRPSATIVRLLVALWIAFGVSVGLNFSTTAAGSDSSGYYNSARYLISGHLGTTLRTVPGLDFGDPNVYAPLGTVSVGDSAVLNPTYPVGLPLHFAVGKLIAGWEVGTAAVGVFAAMGSAALCYLLLRRLGAHWSLAFMGTFALVASPVFIWSSLLPMSDGLATTWVLASVYCARRATENRVWAAACGVAFSIAVLVRPTNILIGPVIALFIWDWRTLALACLSAMPGALWNGYYNHELYGSAFSFGYANLQSLFSFDYFAITLEHYAIWLPRTLPLSVVALVAMPLLPWKRDPRCCVALLLWFGIIFGTYAFYSYTHETWWYLRFVLPAFPAVIAIGVVGIQQWASGRKAGALRGPLLLVSIATLGCSAFWIRQFHVLSLKSAETEYAMASTWVRDNLPSDSLIACMQCSGALYFYTSYPIVRYDRLDDRRLEALKEAIGTSRCALYAVLFPFEVEDDVLAKRMPGTWKQVKQIRNTTIWKFLPDP